jgi:hypothetical protein
MRRHLDFLGESDEHELLFGLKACADPELLIQVVGVDWNFLIVGLLLTVRLMIGGLLLGC